jgi:hypothetical protein
MTVHAQIAGREMDYIDGAWVDCDSAFALCNGGPRGAHSTVLEGRRAMREAVSDTMRELEREIHELTTATYCLPVHLGGVKGAYSELSEAITGEEHHWTR